MFLCKFVPHAYHYYSSRCDKTFVNCDPHTEKFLNYYNHFETLVGPVCSSFFKIFKAVLFHS